MPTREGKETREMSTGFAVVTPRAKGSCSCKVLNSRFDSVFHQTLLAAAELLEGTRAARGQDGDHQGLESLPLACRDSIWAETGLIFRDPLGA